MNAKIKIPTMDGILKFVRASEHNKTCVLVAKEGFSRTIDASSLLAMTAFLATVIVVHCDSCTEELQQLIRVFSV
ncbi:MAG: hypothetical protein MJ130_01825 [Lachnospiraceae bacterium]|nr:hypothetical protein [Lachnospiraceae bacterium]